MSRSLKVLRLLQPSLPGTVMCGNMLVVTPTDYIARGFSLDTTWHKGEVKLWKVVMPLHRPFNNVTLDYSDTIPGESSGRFLIEKQDCAKPADRILEKIALHLPSLEKLRGPQEFVAYIAWRSGSSATSVSIDFGLSHYLTGDVERAAVIFRNAARAAEAQEPKWRGPHAALATLLRDQIEIDPDRLKDMIDGWRDKNIERLGLSASDARNH